MEQTIDQSLVLATEQRTPFFSRFRLSSDRVSVSSLAVVVVLHCHYRISR